jgi:Leucine-rich repeat (LRR) protein
VQLHLLQIREHLNGFSSFTFDFFLQENDWNESYTCESSSLTSSNESFNFIETDHVGNLTNEDVKALKIQSYATPEVPNGILNIKRIFPNINQLYIFSCKVARISRSDFEYFKELLAVSFNNNRLIKVKSDVFADLKVLVSIELSHNELVKLPDEIFYENTELRRVYLSENNLISISSSLFSKNSKLEVVSLYSNNLLTIAPFDTRLQIKRIDLENNLCIDLEIKSSNELEMLNSELEKNCSLDTKPVMDKIRACAVKVSSILVQIVEIKKKNIKLKNLQRRSLVL